MRSAIPARRDRDERFTVLAVAALAGFALIVLGLLRLQIAEHVRYRQLSEENRVRLEVLRAPRGAIYDRNGELLADSYPAFNIVFRPMPAESTERVRATAQPGFLYRLAALVELDTLVVRQMIRTANSSGKGVVLRGDSPPAVLAAVEENRGELPGIEVVVEPLRRYPHGTLAAHLLGYAGEINEDELTRKAAEGYRPGDLIGRSGIERSSEQSLRGSDGAEYVVVNAMGRRVSTYADVASGDWGLIVDPRGWLSVVRGNPANAAEGLGGVAPGDPIWLTAPRGGGAPPPFGSDLATS